MTCAKCEAERCDNCLARPVEKRARRLLSKSGIFRDAKILVVNDGTCSGEVNAYIAGKLITITKLKYAKKLSGSYDFVALPNTADDEAASFLEGMFSTRKKNQKKVIKLLKDSLAMEVAAYAKVKKIKHEKNKTKSDIEVFVDKFEEKLKGSKFSLAKSSEQLSK